MKHLILGAIIGLLIGQASYADTRSFSTITPNPPNYYNPYNSYNPYNNYYNNYNVNRIPPNQSYYGNQYYHNQFPAPNNVTYNPWNGQYYSACTPPTQTFQTQSGWKGVLGSFLSGGSLTGFSPQIDPNLGNNGYSTDKYYQTNRGFYRDQSNVGAGTGVHILD